MRRFAFAGLLAACALSTVSAGLYDSNDAVIQLSGKDFEKKVLKDSGVWIIEVYADWCGHCKSLAPEYKKAAKALQGIVNVAAVDGDKEREIAQRLGVQGFPTIKIYGANKNAPVDYQGPREAKAIVEAAMKEANKIAMERLGGKKAGGNNKQQQQGQQQQKQQKGGNGSGPGEGKAVIKATEETFDSVVLNSNEPVLVEFYAPWCGHCKNMAADWAAAAEEMEGEVKFVAVDAAEAQSLAQRFGIRGFPSIKMFPGGPKTDASAQDYNGNRGSQDFINAAKALLEASGATGSASVTQLTGSETWTENCAGKRLCIVAFLPHILDDKAAKRTERIETLQQAANKVGKRSLFRFLWSEATAQPTVEAALNIGMYPALVAVSEDKKMFVPYRGAFEAAQIVSFVNGLAARADGAMPLPEAKLPSKAKNLVTVSEWDGKDAKAQVEEEFSLDDLDL